MARIIIWHGNRAPTYHHLSWFIIATEYVSRIIQTFALYWIFLNANVKMCSGYDEFRSNLYSAPLCERRFSPLNLIARKRVYVSSLYVYDNCQTWTAKWYTVCSLSAMTPDVSPDNIITNNQPTDISEGSLSTMYTISLSVPQNPALSSTSLFHQVNEFHSCCKTIS